MYIEFTKYIQHVRVDGSFGNHQSNGDGFICGISVQHHLIYYVPFAVR